MSKELTAREIMSLRERNPVTVARALRLYQYNVDVNVRFTHWWVRRFPAAPIYHHNVDKWIPYFTGNQVPDHFDELSLYCYVQNAMDRYGEEAARVYKACGFVTVDEMVLEDGASMKYFGGTWSPLELLLEEADGKTDEQCEGGEATETSSSSSSS